VQYHSGKTLIRKFHRPVLANDWAWKREESAWMASVRKFLRRYSDLPALIHMLETGTITSLDPKTWDDKNDASFMSLYREKRRLKTLLALCFSTGSETYHHWRVFSNGSSGVCVSFKRERLLAFLGRLKGIRAHHVRYLRIRDL